MAEFDVNNAGMPHFGAWSPVPVSERPTDTFRIRVPGGWLVRVYDTVVHSITSCCPGSTGRQEILTITGQSHVIFVPDPPPRPPEAP